MRTRYWGWQYLKPLLHEEIHHLTPFERSWWLAFGKLMKEKQSQERDENWFDWLIENWFVFVILSRVKAAQSELGTQILADFEEAFPSQGSKVIILSQCLRPLLPALHKTSAGLYTVLFARRGPSGPATCSETPAWWPTCWTRASNRKSSRSSSGSTSRSTWCCFRKTKTWVGIQMLQHVWENIKWHLYDLKKE